MDKRAASGLMVRLTQSDAGAALPLVAMMLILLLGMAAFATDLGWIYLNSSRVQKAADASALAGVVYLPGDIDNVNEYTAHGAQANGYSIGSINGSPWPGGGADDLDWAALADNRLEVTLHSTIETFFIKLFGIDSVTITRRATAEYIKPVPIGNPDNDFGDGSDHFWAAINGRWTARIQGDPYQTYCDWAFALDDSSCIDSSVGNQMTYFPGSTILPGDVDADDDALNSDEFRGDGYYYGIEATNGLDFVVQLFDPRFHRPAGSGCGATITEDCDILSFSPRPPNLSSVIGPTTRFRLYAPDETPQIPNDFDPEDLVCDSGDLGPTTDPSVSGVDDWLDLCKVTDPIGGIWVLRVSTSDGSGSNKYGVRVLAAEAGPNPPIYGINEISISTNQDSTTSNLYLAKVDPIHSGSGKYLEVSFYDAGEDDGQASYTVYLPDGVTPATCSWESDGEAGTNGAFITPCIIQTTQIVNGAWQTRFNAQWLRLKIEIPSYSCDMNAQYDCWFTVHIVNDQPHDRTTWKARIIGNPIHLVPNP